MKRYIALLIALIMCLSSVPIDIINFGGNVAKADPPYSAYCPPKDLSAKPTNVTNARTSEFDYYHDAEKNADGTRLVTGSLIYSMYGIAGTANEAASYYKNGSIACDWVTEDYFQNNTQYFTKHGYNAFLRGYQRTNGSTPTTAHLIYSENETGDMSAHSLASNASMITPRAQKYVVANVGDKDRNGTTIKAGDTCYFYDWYTGDYLGSATAGEWLNIGNKYVYNFAAAYAWASAFWQAPSNLGNAKEYIEQNSCALFASSCLTAGNLAWQANYASDATETAAKHDRRDRGLMRIIAEDGFPVVSGNWSYTMYEGSALTDHCYINWPASNEPLYPGDLINVGGGHMMYVGEVGQIAGSNNTKVELYAHSTAYKSNLNAVVKIFHASQYRIDVLVAEQNGSLKITKKNDAGTLMSGVLFTVTGPDNYSSTKSTGSDGIVIFSDLPAGSYTVTESVPSGYAARIIF